MNCAVPLIEKLQKTHGGITYTKEYYKSTTTVTGVDDEAHPNWDETTEFNTDDYVTVPELKRIYRSAADNNTGNFPLATLNTKWVDYGPINSYKMFSKDEFIGYRTTGTNAVFTLDFSQSDTIGLVDIEFSSLLVELIDNDTSEVISSQPVLGSDIGCFNLAEYFYTPKDKIVKRLVLTDFEWLPNSSLRLIFGGEVSIGACVYGLQRNMALSLIGSKLRYENESKIKVNEINGYRDVLRYGRVKILDCSIVFDSDEFNTTSQIVEDVMGKDILWIPTTKDKFSEAITIGYLESFELPMENDIYTETNAKVIGVQENG